MRLHHDASEYTLQYRVSLKNRNKKIRPNIKKKNDNNILTRDTLYITMAIY